MKNNYKRWGVFLILFGSILLPLVHAGYQDTHITKKMIPSVYSNVTIGTRTYWSQVGYIYANGMISYCIEPEVGLSEAIYDSYLDFNVKGLSQSQKERMELIARYGYEYPNHQTDRYYIATQQLLWETIGYTNIYFTTKSQMAGSLIDINFERNEILNLMTREWRRPSFDGTNTKGVYGTKVTLEDQNQVLSSYDIISQKNVEARVSGNQMEVQLSNIGTGSVTLKKKGTQSGTSFVYRKNGSQTLASFFLSSSLESDVTFQIEGGQIEVRKLDADTLENKKSGQATLQGAEYEIKDERGKAVQTVITNAEGIALSKMLPMGTYQVKESKASIGYELDLETYTVTLSENQVERVQTIISKEKVIEQEIEMVKVYNDGSTGIMKPEVKITFSISTLDGTLVTKVTTDLMGRVKFKLPYGSYRVKQENTSPYYEKVKDFEIHVQETKSEPVSYVLSDALVKAKLKVIKVDGVTKEKIRLPNIQFKIKNQKTGLYVTQEVTYPKKEKIELFETDENGEFTTPQELEGGSYLLEEVTPPSGYLLPKSIPFEIDTTYIKDGKIIEIVVENMMPKAQIELIKTGEVVTYVEHAEGLTSKIEKQPLEGVTYQVIANSDMKVESGILAKGSVVTELVTGSDGMVVSKVLPLGFYCVKETSAPLKYQIDTESHCFEVKYKDQDTPIVTERLSFHNELKNKNLYFEKLGEKYVGMEENRGVYQLMSLEGITFGLYNQEKMLFHNLEIESNTLIEKITTNEKGVGLILTNLPEGSYYLKELESPDIYLPDSHQYAFQVNSKTPEQGNVLPTPIINYLKKGSLTIEKKDTDTSTLLTQAEFQYQYEAQALHKLLLTGGTVTFQNMPYGVYEFQETKAPPGYQKKLEKEQITLDDTSKTISFYNQKIVIPKTSASSQYFQLTIFVCFLFGCTLILGSRWVVKWRGLS